MNGRSHRLKGGAASNGVKIAIIGFGREGKSVWKFLKKTARYKKAEIQILDQKSDPHYLRHLDQFDLVFRSPGVPYNLPEIQQAIKNGVRLTSATKLFFELATPILRRGSGQIVGVTGTKGKGTTSTLIYKLLKVAGKRVLLAGNIGKSPLEILPNVTKSTIVILELSSFQLWDLRKSPSVAVITDIFPDHQDVHKGMRDYLDAKASIAKFQKKSDVVFYFQSSAAAKKIAQQSKGKKIAVTAPDTLEKNRILATTVARHLGCPDKILNRAIKTIKGLGHRLELVRTHRGIRYYNDSASTNPNTTAAAITSFTEPMIVIAGGKDKNLNYKPLARAIKKSGQVRLVILMGENKEKIAHSIRRAGAEIRFASDLVTAVQLAQNRAAINHSSIILFSPGAASFDMFADYDDRGAQFKKIIQAAN